MKRTLYMVLASALIVGSAAAQTLGDLARQNRTKKPAAPSKVYDNDTIPKVDSVRETAPEKTAATQEKASTEATATPAGDEEAAAQRQKAETELRAITADLKKQIAQLQRELDVLEREWKLRGAVYYADAGTRLRDQRRWMDEQRKSEAEVAAKKKELEDAKQKLEALRETARKNGFPASATE